MRKFDYDLFVIGGGSGGVRAARISAGLGARVALAEDRKMGGTCVNEGCVPKKLLVYASHYAEDFEDARGYGWQKCRPGFDWPTLRDNKDAEISRLNGIYSTMLEQAGVELFAGFASLAGPNTVQVGARTITAGKILIATGGWPWVPDFPGREHVMTSNEVFHLEHLPKSAIVVGGGYIAVEFAGIFTGLGVETVLLYRGPLFLRGFDTDIREFVAAECRKKGIRLHFNADIASVTREQNRLSCTLQDGSSLHSECVLYATGRRAKISGLGLENAGVRTRPGGAIEVNEEFQTSIPSIHALGDVIGRIELTPVALAEGTALANMLFGSGDGRVDYDAIPTAVFCQPNIGTVGLTEQQAREQGRPLRIYRSDFRAMKHTLSGRDERTLMKMVVDDESDRVLGIHMAGADAGEIIQGMAVAMKAGATKSVFDRTIGIHPTAAEEFVTMRQPSDA